jgi:hypothetical protein
MASTSMLACSKASSGSFNSFAILSLISSRLVEMCLVTLISIFPFISFFIQQHNNKNKGGEKREKYKNKQKNKIFFS